MVMQYGALKHLGLEPAFDLLKVNSQYTNCTIQIKEPSAYACSIMAPKGEINLPKELIAKNPKWQELIETQAVVFNYKGQAAKEKVQIHISDASLMISHK